MAEQSGSGRERAAMAARLLLDARERRVPLAALPEACRPRSLDEAYAAQEAFVAASGGKVVGYKIGATSAKAQTFLSTEGPFIGQVLAENLLDSPASLSANAFNFRLIEPEFAFRLSDDLPLRSEPYGEDEVADAVASLHPAIELVTSGLANWNEQGIASIVADNGVDGALVLGPGTVDWRGLDLARHAVTVFINGEAKGEGQGANALGHPLTALTWLANALLDRGGGLRAGQVVTTGVVTPFHLIGAGDRAMADYGVLGQVELGFT